MGRAQACSILQAVIQHRRQRGAQTLPRPLRVQQRSRAWTRAGTPCLGRPARCDRQGQAQVHALPNVTLPPIVAPALNLLSLPLNPPGCSAPTARGSPAMTPRRTAPRIQRLRPFTSAHMPLLLLASAPLPKAAAVQHSCTSAPTHLPATTPAALLPTQTALPAGRPRSSCQPAGAAAAAASAAPLGSRLPTTPGHPRAPPALRCWMPPSAAPAA